MWASEAGGSAGASASASISACLSALRAERPALSARRPAASDADEASLLSDLLLHGPSLASSIITLAPALVPHLLEIAVRSRRRRSAAAPAGAASAARTECSAAALGQILSLCPQHTEAAAAWLRAGSPLFARLQHGGPQAADAAGLRRVAQAAHLLLRSPRATLLRSACNFAPVLSLLGSEDEVVRWHAARASSLLLGMGDAEARGTMRNLGVDRAATPSEVDAEAATSFGDDASSERAAARQHRGVGGALSASEPYVDVCGVRLPRRASVEVTRSLLLRTATTARNLRAVALAVSHGRPVLLRGASGTGKTAILSELTRLTARPRLVELQLDDH